MKITIDTIKKELAIEDTTSVEELIEFLKGYKDYTVVNKTIVLNTPVTTPYVSSFRDIKPPYTIPYIGNPYPGTKVMYDTNQCGK